jgi:hypothetical protein
MYDYYLGGKDNFPADRVAAERTVRSVPVVRTAARENRAFLVRAVGALANKRRVGQFLDVGTGIPTSPNVHEVVQGLRPTARVVYVDNDPLVLTHARALLTSSPGGRTAYVDADVREPDVVVERVARCGVLDFSRPVALSLVAVLHFVLDEYDPAGIVRRLMEPLASGSYLVLTHGTGDFDGPSAAAGVEVYRGSGIDLRVRSREEVAALVPAEMEIVEPGIVPVHRWPRPSRARELPDAHVGVYGLVAGKP